MAAPKKITKVVEEKQVDYSIILDEFKLRIEKIEQEFLEYKEANKKVEGKSINKVEVFNGEEAPTIEAYDGMKLTDEDKINSMRNAIKILPPNMIIKGRHSKTNVEAICGFKISDEQMDQAYIGIVHES